MIFISEANNMKINVSGLVENEDYLSLPSEKIKGYIPLNFNAFKKIYGTNMPSDLFSNKAEWGRFTQTDMDIDDYLDERVGYESKNLVVVLVESNEKFIVSVQADFDIYNSYFSNERGTIPFGKYNEIDKTIEQVFKFKKTLKKAFSLMIDHKVKPILNTIESGESYKVKNSDELKIAIANLGNNKADLNNLDVSGLDDLSAIFYNSPFNGNISRWNVGNIEDTTEMFTNSKFNGDISKWDVSSVTTAQSMFRDSNFTGDLSKWNFKSLQDGFDFCNLSNIEKGMKLPVIMARSVIKLIFGGSSEVSYKEQYVSAI